MAPYSASFQRTMISSVLKADDGGVSQVPPMAAAHRSLLMHAGSTMMPHSIAQHCRLRSKSPQADACYAWGGRRVLLHCSPLCIIHHAATGCCLPVCPEQPIVTQVGRTLRVGGWVKTGRTAGGGDFAFLELNDGSTFANLQVSGCILAAV